MILSLMAAALRHVLNQCTNTACTNHQNHIIVRYDVFQRFRYGIDVMDKYRIQFTAVSDGATQIIGSGT
jgi:hypothetical protein